MEINKRYKFKDKTNGFHTGIQHLLGNEFIVTGIGSKNVHIQLIGRTQILAINKSYWNDLVEGEVKQTVVGQSKLEFKFL